MSRFSLEVKNSEFDVYIISMDSIKSYLSWDLLGGIAFLLLGKILFHNELLAILCNITVPQMLHFIQARTI